MEKITGNAPQLRSLFPASKQSSHRYSLWSSPEAMTAHVLTVNPSSCYNRNPWDDYVSFRASFSMEHAAQMCRDGWPEGAERAAALRDKINASRPIGPRLVRWDMGGAYPSVPRYLAGNPMHMRRIDPTQLRRKPVLTIMSDFSVNCNLPADCLINRAAVTAAIVDAIEGANYSCEVIAFAHVIDGQLAHTGASVVKEASQAADIGRMAFALGHAAMLRRLDFALRCEDRMLSGFGSGLGYAKSHDFVGMAETYVLPAPTASLFGTPELAATRGLDSMITALRQQGCPAFPQTQAA